MTVVQKSEEPVRARRTSRLVGWGLLAGGALFFIGGGMHPKEDPPDVTVKEHLRIMFEDPTWYPSHAVLLAGMVLIAAALVALVRGTLAVPPAQSAAVLAAVTAVLAAAGMLLHLVIATESDEIDHGHATPLTDVNVVVETITTPAFGLGIAVLAAVGAATRTIGNWVVAVPGVVGGLAYALAGATFLITDRLNFLFPLAAGIGVWAVVAGIALLRRRATAPATSAA